MAFDFGGALFNVTFPQPFAVEPVVTVSLAATSFAFSPEAAATAQVISSSPTQFSGKLAYFTPFPLPVRYYNDVGHEPSMAVVREWGD